MQSRKRSDDKYHSWRWTKLSRAFRERHPLCAECEKQGRITPSQVVDHIIPAEVCDDFWDETNWQALCRKCNAEKGRRLDKKIIARHKRAARNR